MIAGFYKSHREQGWERWPRGCWWAQRPGVPEGAGGVGEKTARADGATVHRSGKTDQSLGWKVTGDQPHRAELEDTPLCPSVLVKAPLAFATSPSFHDVCFLNWTWYFPFCWRIHLHPLCRTIFLCLIHSSSPTHCSYSYCIFVFPFLLCG